VHRAVPAPDEDSKSDDSKIDNETINMEQENNENPNNNTSLISPNLQKGHGDATVS